MANSIELVKKYVYKLASLTDVLESDSATVRQCTNTNEIVIPKIDMDGLADYSRSGGYVEGDDKLTWETIGISFGMLSSRFVCNKVVLEMDTYRFAKYAVQLWRKTTPLIRTNQSRFYTAIDLLDGKSTGEKIKHNILCCKYLVNQ